MDATLVTGWTALCQLLAPAFTQPTSVTFLHIVTGWVLCRSKPTVTSLVCTIGRSLLGHVAKHWTAYERFFYRAVWLLPEVSRLLLVNVVAPLIREQAVQPVIDQYVKDMTGRGFPEKEVKGYLDYVKARTDYWLKKQIESGIKSATGPAEVRIK